MGGGGIVLKSKCGCKLTFSCSSPCILNQHFWHISQFSHNLSHICHTKSMSQIVKCVESVKTFYGKRERGNTTRSHPIVCTHKKSEKMNTLYPIFTLLCAHRDKTK